MVQPIHLLFTMSLTPTVSNFPLPIFGVVFSLTFSTRPLQMQVLTILAVAIAHIIEESLDVFPSGPVLIPWANSAIVHRADLYKLTHDEWHGDFAPYVFL